jgi:hypothetical protein
MRRILSENVGGVGIFFRLAIVMALAAGVAGVVLRLH